MRNVGRCRGLSQRMWRLNRIAHKKRADAMASEMMGKFFKSMMSKWLYELLKHRLGDGPATEERFEKEKSELALIRENYQREVPSFIFPNNTLRDSMFENVLFSMDWAYFRERLTLSF